MSLRDDIPPDKPGGYSSENRPSGGPWSSDRLTQRALSDLHEAGHHLDRRGVDPLDALQTLLFRSLLWRASGANLPEDIPLSIVRGYPGLESWDICGAFQCRHAQLIGMEPDSRMEGIEPTDAGERGRRHRAHVLSDWIRKYAGLPVVEEVVQAAEEIAVRTLERAVAEEVAV